MVNAVEVNIPLGEFATALRRHDMLYPYSDDARVYWNEAQRRDGLIAMAKRLVAGGEPILHVMAIVELEAQKQFPTSNEWDAYIEQFQEAVER